MFEDLQNRVPKLTPLFAGLQPISLNKKKDLMSLLSDNVIPQYYTPFYDALVPSKKVRDSFPYLEEVVGGEDLSQVITLGAGIGTCGCAYGQRKSPLEP